MKIGEILVSKGYVTQQQLDGVMAVKGDDVQVGQVLIQWGLLTEQQLMEALGFKLHLLLLHLLHHQFNHRYHNNQCINNDLLHQLVVQI